MIARKLAVKQSARQSNIMSTIYRPPQQGQGSWYEFDAQGQTLGRFAAQIAFMLLGKHLVTYTPFWNYNQHIVVINADKFDVTGNKREDKIYYRHTGYPGGIKSMRLLDALRRQPTFALRRAVRGMLPKNRLSRQLLNNLYLYTTENHPHAGQNPIKITGRIDTKKALFQALREQAPGAFTPEAAASKAAKPAGKDTGAPAKAPTKTAAKTTAKSSAGAK